jgi:hypothetical protein
MDRKKKGESEKQARLSVRAHGHVVDARHEAIYKTSTESKLYFPSDQKNNDRISAKYSTWNSSVRPFFNIYSIRERKGEKEKKEKRKEKWRRLAIASCENECYYPGLSRKVYKTFPRRFPPAFSLITTTPSLCVPPL